MLLSFECQIFKNIFWTVNMNTAISFWRYKITGSSQERKILLTKSIARLKFLWDKTQTRNSIHVRRASVSATINHKRTTSISLHILYHQYIPHKNQKKERVSTCYHYTTLGYLDIYKQASTVAYNKTLSRAKCCCELLRGTKKSKWPNYFIRIHTIQK